MPYAWLRVAIDTWFLGLECSNVVALRMIKLAVGGPRAKAESHRMVEEKLAALVALQWQLLTGGLGLTGWEIARGSLRHYRKTVQGNRRRLARYRR
jgi:hypothetical protein